MANDKLTGLAALAQGTLPPEDPEEAEEQLMKDTKAILEHALQLAGDDLFQMQALIENCAEELRGQIQDLVEGGDDE